MAEGPESGVIAILERLLRYCQKVFDLPSALSKISDSRKLPQIPTTVIAKSVLTMNLAQLGSLNAIEQLKGSTELEAFLNAPLPSADTLGRVFALVDPDTIRKVNLKVYERLKRNKALIPPWHGLMPMVIDGHESHATFNRCCEHCLERKVGVGEKKRVQYYHRNVTAQLVSEGIRFQLDAEPQLAGEDEVAAAIRLILRILNNYPRAFDVVLGDALYARSEFINLVVEHHKDVVIVLKGNCPELLQDAVRWFDGRQPVCTWEEKKKTFEAWDESGFVSGPQTSKPLRVVQSFETKAPVRLQLDDTIKEESTTWMWLTTLSPMRARTRAVVELGHFRWSIENKGFNELVTYWCSDHVYKHDPCAILNFWLMSLLAHNLFQAFFLLNIKGPFRRGKTMLHFASMIKSQLYACLPAFGGVPP